jgi:hypothetical protein
LVTASSNSTSSAPDEQEAAGALEQNDGATFLDVRTAVLNDMLEDAFRTRCSGLRPDNGEGGRQP